MRRNHEKSITKENMENHPTSIIKHKQRVRTMVASMMKPVLGFQEEVRISMVNLVRQ